MIFPTAPHNTQPLKMIMLFTRLRNNLQKKTTDLISFFHLALGYLGKEDEHSVFYLYRYVLRLRL